MREDVLTPGASDAAGSSLALGKRGSIASPLGAERLLLLVVDDLVPSRFLHVPLRSAPILSGLALNVSNGYPSYPLDAECVPTALSLPRVVLMSHSCRIEIGRAHV